MLLSVYIKPPASFSTFTNSMLWTTRLAHPHKVPRSLDGGNHRSKAITPAINSCFMGLSLGAKLLVELPLRSNQKELLLEVIVAGIHGA